MKVEVENVFSEFQTRNNPSVFRRRYHQSQEKRENKNLWQQNHAVTEQTVSMKCERTRKDVAVKNIKR